MMILVGMIEISLDVDVHVHVGGDPDSGTNFAYMPTQFAAPFVFSSVVPSCHFTVKDPSCMATRRQIARESRLKRSKAQTVN